MGIPGTIPLSGTLAPSDETDVFAITDAIYQIDGLRSVADHAARNAITTDRRRQGMLVNTQDDGKYWTLLAPPWTGTDNDWHAFSSGAGTTFTYLLGVGVPVATGTNLTNGLIATSPGVIQQVYAYAKTAPTGAGIIIQINVNGSPIWTDSDSLIIADGARSANTSIFDLTVLASGDVLTIDVDQVGSMVPGQDVTVQVLVGS